ncbi:MAG: DUF692 family multinuclear iron-containing protein, partial [Fibrobacteria bacterium]
MIGKSTSVPLGVGMVWAPGIEPLLEPGMDLIDVVEIEPQLYRGYVPGEARPCRMQDGILPHLAGLGKPVLVHGMGGAAGITESIKPAWVSGHLGFLTEAGRDERYFTGMMLPPLQTPEGVQSAVRHLRAATQGFDFPFALETQVNHMQSRCSTLGDGDFLARVVRGADCGILLDLGNILANEKNGRQPVEEYLASLPLDRVWEAHLGGTGPLSDELLALTESVLPRLRNLKALILEVTPNRVPGGSIEWLARQLELMRKLWDGRGKRGPGLRASPLPASTLKALPGGLPITPALWERALGEWTALGHGKGALFEHLRGDRGMET